MTMDDPHDTQKVLCFRCGRVLKSRKSIELGMGRGCAKRVKAQLDAMNKAEKATLPIFPKKDPEI